MNEYIPAAVLELGWSRMAEESAAFLAAHLTNDIRAIAKCDGMVLVITKKVQFGSEQHHVFTSGRVSDDDYELAKTSSAHSRLVKTSEGVRLAIGISLPQQHQLTPQQVKNIKGRAECVLAATVGLGYVMLEIERYSKQ